VQSELTNTQRDIQKAAREFAEKEFDLDLALELDKEARFPVSIFEKACRLGFVGIEYPEEYGGQSFGLFENVLVTQEFCKRDSGIGISISLADIASGILFRHGDENQKKNFLTPVIQGKAISTVATINSSNGSEKSTIPSIVEEYPDELVLNGETPFVINGSIASYIVVFCKSKNNKLISLIVERNQEGVENLGLQRMMGLRMSSISKIRFDHVRIRKDHWIGEESEGTEHLRCYLIERRIKTSSQALGIAQGAFDLALKHSKQREQFGKKICQFQGVQFMLAELYTLIEAAGALVYQAARSYDSQSSDMEKISSVAKLFTTDVAVKIIIDSIQIHGGVGLMREYSIERMLRDTKTIKNLEETILIQKALIAGEIL